VKLVLVKGENPRRATAWVTRDEGSTKKVVIIPSHDLPYLVVESLFGLTDGEWAARLSPEGYPHFDRASELPAGIKTAKRLSNAVANAFGDGPNTAAGVRERVGPSPVLGAIDDTTIEAAIAGVGRIMAMWAAVEVGDKLEVAWPLDPGTLDQ
jgi:hypothetical protein